MVPLPGGGAAPASNAASELPKNGVTFVLVVSGGKPGTPGGAKKLQRCHVDPPLRDTYARYETAPDGSTVVLTWDDVVGPLVTRVSAGLVRLNPLSTPVAVTTVTA
jgi:hypothetical protein